MNARLAAFAAALIAVAATAFPALADARTHGHDLTKVFADVNVGPHDVVDGDLNVIFGNTTIEGTVHGDVNTIFGSCTATASAVIDGNRNCVQGDFVRAAAPWLLPHEFSPVFGEPDRALVSKLAWSAIVVVIFLLFPLRTRIALDRVERHPGLCAAAGAIAAVFAVPIALLLVVILIGIPLALLEGLTICAACWIGTAAIALLLGRRLCELVMPNVTPPPLAALLIGLVIVSAAEILPFIGWVVTALVWVVGLGAAMLAFVRTSYLDARFRAPITASPARPSRR